MKEETWAEIFYAAGVDCVGGLIGVCLVSWLDPGLVIPFLGGLATTFFGTLFILSLAVALTAAFVLGNFAEDRRRLREAAALAARPRCPACGRLL